eukprot:TRINITY_DN3785_c0_g3_i1.p1 TRINITY_DN3785_c0_g3~~TRINITY_DN3785_c0_g3_i1.p1  ORF type:complete len:1042 (+),score=420.21 TRINITY_DN3785_c0_g3_i1:98-3127(+)
MPSKGAAGGAVRGVRALAQDVDPAEVLRKFDKDGDGDLDAAEMREVSKREQARRHSLENTISRALDRERELKARNAELDEQLRQEAAVACSERHPILQQLDRDNDGSVDMEELEAANLVSDDELRTLRARLGRSVEMPQLKLAPGLLDYPKHIADRKRTGAHIEAGGDVRERLAELDQWIRRELQRSPAPGPQRAEALRSSQQEVTRLIEFVAEAETLCSAQYGVDASAAPDHPIPGPTPVPAIGGLADVLGTHTMRWSQLRGRLELLGEQRAAVQEAIAALAAPLELGELEERPPPLRLPERESARQLGWDRLWDGRRRAECAHVLRASQQRWADLSEDISVGLSHVEQLAQEQQHLRDSAALVTEMRQQCELAQREVAEARRRVDVAAQSYLIGPEVAIATSEADEQLLRTCVKQTLAKDQAARTQYRKQYGRDADWYQISRRAEQDLQSQLQSLRASHDSQVRTLTRQLEDLHDEKKSEEQRLMAASMQYFEGVERRQRQLVGELEKLQTDFRAKTDDLIEQVRTARAQRRDKEQGEMANMEAAMVEEHKRQVAHSVTMERLNEVIDKTLAARPYFVAAASFAKVCVNGSEKFYRAQQAQLHEQRQRMEGEQLDALRALHGSIGRSYLLLAQLVYKNGVRRSELETQTRLVKQQLEFCRDTWDPNEHQHQNTLTELGANLVKAQDAEVSWQARMRELLLEQRSLTLELHSRGVPPAELPDAKKQLGALFAEQEARRQERASIPPPPPPPPLPPPPPPPEGAPPMITAGPTAAVTTGGCVSPVRAWQDEHDRIAEQKRALDEEATQAEFRWLQEQRTSRLEQERQRLERLRMQALSTAVQGRTQHIAKRHIRRQQKKAPSRSRDRPVNAAVIRLDFPEVIAADAIELPPEPTRLDPGDARVRRLLDFDALPQQDAAATPPAQDPAAVPAPAPAPAAAAAGEGEAHTAQRLEAELLVLAKRGSITALSRKREELITHLCKCLEVARAAEDAPRVAQLLEQLAKYQDAD